MNSLTIAPSSNVNQPSQQLRQKSKMLLEENNSCFHFDCETKSQEIPIWTHLSTVIAG